MKTYLVEEGVSGESREVRAKSAPAAVRDYLKDQVVNEKASEWCWDFTVSHRTHAGFREGHRK